MRKNKNRLGKSLKIIMSDINNLSVSNIYIDGAHNKEKKSLTDTIENLILQDDTKDLNKAVESDMHFPFDLEKIGCILKEEREKKSLTIEDISNVLNVRRPILEALEKGLWEKLPHEVYVRGYIKKYANILNVEDAILPYLNIKNKSTSTIVNSEKNFYKKQMVLNKWSSVFSKTSFLYTAIVVFIISAFIILNINKENEENEKLEKAIQLSNNVQDIEKQQTSVLPNNKRLMITCHERAWISVIMDGKEKKEFILNSGEMVILNAKERFDILVGNAGGIKFLLNGKEVEFSGASGQVKKITL